MLTSLNRLYFYFFERLLNFFEFKRPEILYFNADRKLSQRQDLTVLRWHVRHVNKVTINGILHPSRGQILIADIEKSKFTLHAVNKKGEASSDFTVFENPYRLDFTEKHLTFPAKLVGLISKVTGINKNINHSKKELALNNVVLERKNRQMEISKAVFSGSKQINGRLLLIDKKQMEASWQKVQEEYQV